MILTQSSKGVFVLYQGKKKKRQLIKHLAKEKLIIKKKKIIGWYEGTRIKERGSKITSQAHRIAGCKQT